MQTVEFFSSSGTPIRGDLHVPDSPRPASGHPAVVACLGWGSVKELMGHWGEAFAARGYAMLVPDYRGFGASGGKRGQCFPSEHVDDTRAAVTYAGSLESVDSSRVALVGVSYGGAIAVATGGADSRVRAVISVVGYGSGARHLRAVRTAEQWSELLSRLASDRLRRVVTGESLEIDSDDVLLRDAEARAWRTDMERKYPHMAFRTTLESVEKIIEFLPEDRLPYRSSTPLLLVHAGADAMVPVEESQKMWERASEPKRLVIIPGIGHHEVHTGTSFERVIEESSSWLDAHLSRGGDDV